jgi:hypothetical protein
MKYLVLLLVIGCSNDLSDAVKRAKCACKSIYGKDLIMVEESPFGLKIKCDGLPVAELDNSTQVKGCDF